MSQFFWYALTSSNINRFSKLFHFQNQEKMRNNAITKDRTVGARGQFPPIQIHKPAPCPKSLLTAAVRISKTNKQL